MDGIRICWNLERCGLFGRVGRFKKKLGIARDKTGSVEI